MLIDFTEEMIKKGIKHFVAAKYGANIDTIDVGVFDLDELINGSFTNTMFGIDRPRFFLPLTINGTEVQEVISDGAFIFEVYKQFISNELKFTNYSIEEAFTSEKDENIQVVNIYAESD